MDKFLRSRIFSEAEEKPHLNISPALTIYCVLNEKIFRCVQLHCPELCHRFPRSKLVCVCEPFTKTGWRGDRYVPYRVCWAGRQRLTFSTLTFTCLETWKSLEATGEPPWLWLVAKQYFTAGQCFGIENAHDVFPFNSMQEFPAMQGQIQVSDIEGIMSKKWQITSSFLIDTDLSSFTLGMWTGALCVFPQMKHPMEQCQQTKQRDEDYWGKEVLGT